VIDFRASRWRTYAVSLALVLGTLAIYWPARHYGFVDYDDNDYVFNNPTVRAGLSGEGLVWSVVDQHANNWHPLTWLSHMLDCQLFGLQAGAHHMVSVLIHCANAVLLLLMLNSLTGAFWRSACVAALFAWHPLRVESVAWISERKDVLSGFFFMLTLWMFALYVKKEMPPVPATGDAAKPPGGSSGSPRKMLFNLSLVFFVLDFWPLNRWPAAGGKFSRAETAKNLLSEKLPFFLLSAVFGVIAFFAQRAGGAVGAAPHREIFSRLGDALIGYVSYLEKIVWPQDLTVLYLRPEVVKPGWLLSAVFVLAAISLLAMINRLRRPWLAMGWLWFLGMLLPVSGVISFGLQSIADRYTYLPSIGIFIMCTWGAAEFATRSFRKQQHQFLPAVAVAAVLGVNAGLSRHQLAYWENTQTLMEHALEIDPDNYIAHGDLGIYFSRMGRTQDALRQYQQERELDPNLAHPSGENGHTNLTQPSDVSP
jgi:tetratricopeptide (TPR) repeat protein